MHNIIGHEERTFTVNVAGFSIVTLICYNRVMRFAHELQAGRIKN